MGDNLGERNKVAFSNPDELRKIANSVRHDVVPMAGVEHIAQVLEWSAAEIERLLERVDDLRYEVMAAEAFGSCDHG